MYNLICKVMIRLETGDKVILTGKSSKEENNSKVLERLNKAIEKEATPLILDTLYYTVRVTKNDVKDNWKCTSLAEVYQILDEVFA